MRLPRWKNPRFGPMPDPMGRKHDEITPGEAFGNWPALGPPIHLQTTSPSLIVVQAIGVAVMMMLCVAGFALQLALGDGAKVHLALPAGAFVLGVGLTAAVARSCARDAFRAPSYIYVSDTVVEVCVRFEGEAEFFRTRFARQDLSALRNTARQILNSGEVRFDRPIKVRVQGRLGSGLIWPSS